MRRIGCIHIDTPKVIGTPKVGTTVRVQHRPSTAAMDADIVTIAAAKAVTKAAVRGTAAVIIVQIASINATMITETGTGAMVWAKLLVAIIVLLGGIQTGVCGIHTPRSRTAIIGTVHRQRDHRVL